jgi:hypothetical protein
MGEGKMESGVWRGPHLKTCLNILSKTCFPMSEYGN